MINVRRLAHTVLFAVLLGSTAFAQTQNTLKIVVVEGEGAVNVIQQKTAVTPVVEVRDRNDQPVAGVLVTFSIRSGSASFGSGGSGGTGGSAQTLSVTTNALGQAAATGLVPAGAGALSIVASAVFQGATATATISQVNVMTAAQAAAASSAGTAGTASAGGAAGTATAAGTAGTASVAGAAAAGGAAAGGGISATTIGIIAGAGAGAALGVSKVAGGDSAPQPQPQPKTEIKTLTGAYSGTFVVDFPGCSNIHSVNGTMTLRLTLTDGVVVSGTTTMTESRIVTNTTCPDKSAIGTAAGFPPPPSSLTALPKMDFTTTTTNNWTGLNNAGNSTQTWTFEGSLNGSKTEVTGALTDRVLTNQTTPTPISAFGNGVAVFSVTLR